MKHQYRYTSISSPNLSANLINTCVFSLIVSVILCISSEC
nr:MAG TPA: hypothetical protein [Caudoviricetes sp.]